MIALSTRFDNPMVVIIIVLALIVGYLVGRRRP